LGCDFKLFLRKGCPSYLTLQSMQSSYYVKPQATCLDILCDPHLMQPEILQAQQQAYARKSQRMQNHSPRSQQQNYFHSARPRSPNSPNQHFTPFVQTVQVPMMPIPQSSAFTVPTTYFHYGGQAAYHHHPHAQIQWRPVQHAI